MARSESARSESARSESAGSRSWFRRLTLPVRIALIAVVATLVAAAGHWTYRVVTTCSSGVDLVDGECIGVSDGTVALAQNPSQELSDVFGKIGLENENIDRLQRDAVSVAYLVPLPMDSSSFRARTMISELEGAYLAQHRANQPTGRGGEPAIRLLIANIGDRSSQWERVVPTLVDKVDGPDHLVAVVATGESLTPMQNAIGELISQGIPVIASRLTGDSLTPPSDDPHPVQGLARLAPSNSDQAAAAAAFLKSDPGMTRALLIQNTDPKDTYAQSLGEAFTRTFPDDEHTMLTPTETYNSQLDGVANTMKGMLPSICQQHPDVIFFAGRSPELEALVEALPSRPCPELPINLMSGDSTVSFATAVAHGGHELRNGLMSKASVRYTALAHPQAWEADPGSFAQGSRDSFQSACSNCFHNHFPGASLDSGSAIMGYDAIITAVTAISTREGINTKPNLIIQEFNRMHGRKAVPGASGWISLDERGKPVNKAVPILEVQADGTVKFEKLSSPRASGEPCRPDVPELC